MSCHTYLHSEVQSPLKFCCPYNKSKLFIWFYKALHDLASFCLTVHHFLHLLAISRHCEHFIVHRSPPDFHTCGFPAFTLSSHSQIPFILWVFVLKFMSSGKFSLNTRLYEVFLDDLITFHLKKILSLITISLSQ